MKILKLFTVVALLWGASSHARHFTTYGQGQGVDYYGNRFAACNTAQRAANYEAVRSCQYQRGIATNNAASACSCSYRVVYGRRAVVCVANARATCSASYQDPRYPRYPDHGRDDRWGRGRGDWDHRRGHDDRDHRRGGHDGRRGGDDRRDGRRGHR